MCLAAALAAWMLDVAVQIVNGLADATVVKAFMCHIMLNHALISLDKVKMGRSLLLMLDLGHS